MEQVGERATIRQAQLGREIGQRTHYERALSKARMRENQRIGMQHLVSIEQQINIYGAWSPALAALTLSGLLDCLNTLQQRLRCQGRRDPCYTIEMRRESLRVLRLQSQVWRLIDGRHSLYLHARPEGFQTL